MLGVGGGSFFVYEGFLAALAAAGRLEAGTPAGGCEEPATIVGCVGLATIVGGDADVMLERLNSS